MIFTVIFIYNIIIGREVGGYMQINIGFGINDKYCQHCAVTIASILANANDNDKYKFYIVYNKLSDENKTIIENLKNIKPFQVEYIKVEMSDFIDFAQYSKIDISSFFRIKLFTLEGVDKILYMDSDVIVRTDIGELYKQNLGSNYIGGAKDILWQTLKKRYKLTENSIYVNAGVLLINTKKARELDIPTLTKSFCDSFGNLEYSDQDVINYMCQEKIFEFDIRWNYCYPFVNEYEQQYYNSIASNPCCIHYITNNKPWNPGNNCFMKNEYFKYLKMTPFYKEVVDAYMLEEHSIILARLEVLNKKFDFMLEKLFNRNN